MKEKKARVAVTAKKGGRPFALRTGEVYMPRGVKPKRLYLDYDGKRRLALEIGGAEQKGTVAYTHPAKGPYAPDGVTRMDNGASAPALVQLHSGGEDASYPVMPVFRASA